jgi:hypothetical protein
LSAVTAAAAPAVTEDPSRIAAEDEQCARRTFETLIAAVNAADEARLASLFGRSFQWLAVKGAATYEVPTAIERLLAVRRAGEQWELKRLDVNGRGSHGGVDFGVVIRRSGPNVPDPFRDAAGKGVLDCPAERVMLFGLGDST